jgi:threonine/homoserine/homoserine lactone efflux protein
VGGSNPLASGRQARRIGHVGRGGQFGYAGHTELGGIQHLERQIIVIFDLTIIGLAITLEPIPLTAFILVLASQRGARKGAAFVLGWLLSLAIVVGITVLATGNSPPKPNTAPSLTALAVKILLGLVLLFIALRTYRRLGRPKRPKKTPKWQAGVDNMSLGYALALATLVQPWGLIAAGAATVVEAKLASWEDYLALAYFCLLATGAYVVMVIYATVRPEATQGMLTRLRLWIESHTDLLIMWVSLVVGCWLVGKSIYVIVT